MSAKFIPACLTDGWDVVDVEELSMGEAAWTRLSGRLAVGGCGRAMVDGK